MEYAIQCKKCKMVLGTASKPQKDQICGKCDQKSNLEYALIHDQTADHDELSDKEIEAIVKRVARRRDIVNSYGKRIDKWLPKKK